MKTEILYTIYFGLNHGWETVENRVGETVPDTIHPDYVRRILPRLFKQADIYGATVTFCEGLFEGQYEQSVKIEIIETYDTNEPSINLLADSIRTAFYQREVLVTKQKIETRTIK